jgi:MFS family permease
LSGVGAVGLATGGFRLLTLLPESKQQNLSMGAFSLILGLSRYSNICWRFGADTILGSSIVVGPILGGVIVDSLNWHWIFYINLPVMGLVLICVMLAMMAGGPDLRGEHYAKTWAEKRQHLDWLGTGLLALVMTCFILGLQFSQSDGWNSARVITLFVVSGAAVPALIVQQVRTKKRKIFDPEVVAHRGVWTTLGLFGTALADLVTVILFLPFTLQVSRSLQTVAVRRI